MPSPSTAKGAATDQISMRLLKSTGPRQCAQNLRDGGFHEGRDRRGIGGRNEQGKKRMQQRHMNVLAVAVVMAVMLAGVLTPASAAGTGTILRTRNQPRLCLRGGYGSESVTSWSSLPRRAYKWMTEGWRRVRNPRAGKEALPGDSPSSSGIGKRSAPLTESWSGAGSSESKRRRKEVGPSTARIDTQALRGGRSKGFGSTSKELAKAGAASEAEPHAQKKMEPGLKAEVAGMSAQELLREAEMIKSCGDGLYTIEKVGPLPCSRGASAWQGPSRS